MSEPTQKTPSDEKQRQDAATRETSSTKPGWETPTMEDVSEQVMAQPYIRFT